MKALCQQPAKWIRRIDKLFEFSLYLLVLAIPFSKSVIEISISVIIFCWLARRIIHKDSRLSHLPHLRPWLLFLFFCFLSIFVAEYFQLSLRAFFSKYLTYFGIFIAIHELIQNQRVFRNVLIAGAIALTATMLNGYIQYVWGVDISGKQAQIINIQISATHYKDIKRIGGAFSHPNNLGTYLIAMIPLLVSCCILFIKKQRYFWIAFTLLATALLTLFLTQSRGAAIALIAAYTVGLFLWKKKWGLIFFILIFGFIYAAPFPLAKNIRNSIRLERASLGSIKDRIHLWQTTSHMIREKPFLGWGLNNYSRIHPRFKGQWDSWYTHNCYLQMASEIGIPGAIAFLWLVGAVLAGLTKGFRSHPDPFCRQMLFGCLVSVLALSFHAAVDTLLYSLPLVTLFWVVVSLSTCYSRTPHSSHPSETGS